MESFKNNRKRLMVFAVFVTMAVSTGLADGIADEENSGELPEIRQEALVQEPAPAVEAEMPVAEDSTVATPAFPEELPESRQEALVQEPVPAVAEAGLPEVESSKAVTRVFPVINLDINEAKERVRPLLSKDGQIGSGVDIFTFQRAGKDVKSLVVRDTPEKIEEVGAVLEQMEKELAPVTVSLDFNDVPLGKILTTIARITNLNIVGGEEISDKVSVHIEDVPIDDAFDIILRSTGYTYIRDGKVLQIVSKEKAPFITEVFELQFVSAEQVKDAVSHLISEKGSVKAFSKLSQSRYASFLIVTDTPASLQNIREVVKKLDKRKKQLMIEVKFCEVSLDKNNELGIDWVISGSLTGAAGKTTFPFNDNGMNLLRPPADHPTTSQALTLGTISFTDFASTVHALDTKTTVNLIASPRVAAMEGEEAEIVIGDVVPIPLYERNSETGTMEISGYQDENVGTLLKVTPIINNDNTITLYVHPEVSEITDYTGPNNERPVISTRKISTVFTLEDGKTVVLGGLMKQVLTNNLNKVPFLGNIPLIGRIFKYQGDVEARTELLIFITPHILNNP
jgi:type IV pilus secretin PilQ/predicted competence protein